MANATSTQLQELYVAYFGRAADPTGLDYWTSKGITTTKFAADMYAQAEFKDAYGSLSVEAQVNQIYKNLFDRDADVTGLTYWTQQINLGNLKLAEIATDLIWAAQNNSGSSDDKTALTNRTNAAVAYTAEVKESTAAILAYAPTSTDPWTSGANITTAINYLSGIDKDTAHTAAGITASVASIVSAGVQSATVAGKTYTLTTAQDNITGTAGADSATGLSTTLTTGDTIDLGAGTDSLSYTQTISGATSVAGFTLTNVEKLSVNLSDGNTAAAHTVTVNTLNSSADTLEVAGLSTSGSSDVVAFTNVKAGTKISMANNTDVSTTATFVTAATSGTADSVSAEVSGVTASAATDAILTIATGFETLNLNTTGSASSLGDIVTSTATTLNVTGDQNLTVTADLDASLTTINASDFTGQLSIDIADNGTPDATSGGVDVIDVTITGGSGNDNIDTSTATADVELSVNAGAGDDLVKIGQILGEGSTTVAADVIAGGTGTDTLQTDVDYVDAGTALITGLTTVSGALSGFETLNLIGFGIEANTVNLANISSEINKVTITEATGGSTTINAPGSLTIDIKGTAILGADDLIVDSGTGSADTLTITNTNLATGTNQIGDNATDIITTDFETVTIDVGGYSTATAQLVKTINVGALNALVLTGANGLTTTASTGIITAKTIDASSMTGALTMNVAAASGVTTITGGSGSDTLKGDAASTISGGAGNDAITGGTGNDTLSGGAGNDTITTNTGTDAVTGGAGNDTLTVAGNLTALDTFDGGEGTDTISLTNASLSVLNGFSISEASTFNASFNNVEKLTVSDALNQTTFDIGYLDSVSTVKLAGSIGAETLSGIDSGDTIQLTETLGGALTLSVNNASTGTADVINVGLVGDADDDYISVSIANVETMNFDATETTASTDIEVATIGMAITQATGGGAQTVNFTGTESFTVDTAIAAGTIDASGMTVAAKTEAKLTMSTAHTKAQTITGSGGVDTLYGSTKADTINAGIGADILHPGLGGDTIDGGADTDTFHTTGMVGSTGTGTGTSTGVVINMGSSAISAATVTSGGGTAGEYIAGGLTSIPAGQIGLVYNTQDSNFSAELDTISNVENITLAANGMNYVVGSDAANVIVAGTGTDYIEGGLGNDTITTGVSVGDIVKLGTATGTTSGTDKVTMTALLDGGEYFDGTATDGIINNIATEDLTESTSTTFGVGNFITGFEVGTDVIQIDGALEAVLEYSGTTVVMAAAGDNDHNAGGIFIVDNGIATTADFGDISDVVADIDTAFTGGSNGAAGDQMIVVLSNAGNTQKGIYYFLDADGNADLGADVGDTLALLAIVDHTSSADFTATSIVVV
jgi:hypothetical protein